MSPSKARDYHTAMVAMNAESALLDIQTSNFSKYKKNARGKILRDLKKRARAFIGNTSSKPVTYGEVIKNLRSKLGG